MALGVIATGMTIKNIEKSVKTHVQDQARQQQALALLEKWEDEGKALKKEYKKQREILVDLVKKHDAEQAAFDTIINEIITMDQRTSKRLLDIQYDLRQSITTEEWNNVFSGKK